MSDPNISFTFDQSRLDRIRQVTATGQPDLNDTLHSVRFADCEPCVAQAVQDWRANGTVDWAALTAAGADLIAIDPTSPGRFVAILVVEEEQTADRRIIAEGATSWRNPPLSAMLMTTTADGHDGAQVCAVIEQIVRQDRVIAATGRWDNSDVGLEAARLVANRILTGVSIDAGDVEGEVLVTKEDDKGNPTEGIARMTALKVLGMTICPFQAIGSSSIAYVGPDGALADDDVEKFTAVLSAFSEPFVAEDPATLAQEVKPKPHDFVDADNNGKCDVCNLSEADHTMVQEALAVEAQSVSIEALAAAGPLVFAPALFVDPLLAGPTPITVGADGHVFGHAAVWGQCHISFPGACVTAPRSLTNYGHFRTGSVNLTDGTVQPVGTIALNTGHADKRFVARDASAHYDHTGMAAAFVNVGEDAHGIWVSGVLRPDLSDADATVLAASSLSGDWRRIGGNLELVALLSVNTPGFPIAHVASGAQLSLVAAGFGHVAARDDWPATAAELVETDPAVWSEQLAKIIDSEIETRIAALGAEVAKLRAEMKPVRLAAVREAFAVVVEVAEAEEIADVADVVEGADVGTVDE